MTSRTTGQRTALNRDETGAGGLAQNKLSMQNSNAFSYGGGMQNDTASAVWFWVNRRSNRPQPGGTGADNPSGGCGKPTGDSDGRWSGEWHHLRPGPGRLEDPKRAPPSQTYLIPAPSTTRVSWGMRR